MMASRFSSECPILLISASFVWVTNSTWSSSFLREISSIFAIFADHSTAFLASKLWFMKKLSCHSSNMLPARSTHQSTFLGGLQLLSDFLRRQRLGGGVLLDCFRDLDLIDARLGENHLVTQSTLAFLLAANFSCYFEGENEFQLKLDIFRVSPVDRRRFCLESSAACIGADSCMSHPLRCTSEASQRNDVFHLCSEGGEAKDEAIAYTARMKMNKKLCLAIC